MEPGMAITKEQEDLYKKTMNESKSQINEIDAEMQKIITETRKKLEKLQESKKSLKQMYESAVKLLNLPIEEDGQEKES